MPSSCSILQAALAVLLLPGFAPGALPGEGRMRLAADGSPRAVYAIRSDPRPGTAEEAARSFLAERMGTLMISGDGPALRTETVQTPPGGSHVRFVQTVDGIPVHGGDLVVSMDTLNRVRMVMNNAATHVRLPETSPALSADAAVRAAREALGVRLPSIGRQDEAALVAYRTTDDGWHLAYRVTITSEDPAGDWEVMIDALDGGELARTDLFVEHTGLFVNGSGQAYLQDPLTAAGRMYGSAGFADNDDADSDSLTWYRSAVPLDSLRISEGMVLLDGPWCTITEIETPADPPFFWASTPEGFSFTRSDQRFEAVSAYYHVSTSCRYLESLGFRLPRLREIRVDPHGFQGQDNSHYSPSGNWIAFGEGGVDDAEDADVIWHEHGHAIIFAVVPGWGGGESGALGEGIADYWAASYGRSVGGWPLASYHHQWLFNWDGHNPFWAGRILNDPRTYPFGPLPAHSAGQIVSAGLMGINGDIGRAAADRLLIKALHYLGSGATARDFAEAMIEADHALYEGVHVPTIAYWLGTVKRFIDPAPYMTEAGEEAARPEGFTLGPNYPNPFNSSTTVPFALPTACHVRLSVYDLAGREVASLFNGALPPGNHVLRWDGRTGGNIPAGSGLYFYRLDATDGGRRFSANGSMLLVK